MNIRRLLDKKGREVVTAPPSLPVPDVARLMNDHNIGSVVVVEEGVVQGIVTERDILRLVGGDDSSMEKMTVEEAMTSDVIVGVPGDSLDYVMEIMTRNRIRHLPVVAAGGLEGILSVGDIIDALRKNVEAENRYMLDYIQGKVF